jgi:hypothetical protein
MRPKVESSNGQALLTVGLSPILYRWRYRITIIEPLMTNLLNIGKVYLSELLVENMAGNYRKREEGHWDIKSCSAIATCAAVTTVIMRDVNIEWRSKAYGRGYFLGSVIF